MKKMTILLFLAGIAYVASGADCTNDIHISNIERAITGLPVMLSNSLGTVRYDFSAILREIKAVKEERLRIELLEKCIQPLFSVDEKQWKHNPNTEMFRKRESMLEEAFALTEGAKYIGFRWSNRLRMHQSMKKELSFYADAPNPDAVRAALWPKQKEEFKREYEKLRAQSKEKVIIISRTLPPSKEWSDAADRWGYKKWLESSIMFYEKDNFDVLKFKIDYEDLPAAERQPLMERVRKELGRYPKWYKAEKDEIQPLGVYSHK